MGKINEVRVIQGGKGTPFLCGVCQKVDKDKDYLEFFYEDSPNSVCVHSDCAAIKLFPQRDISPQTELLHKLRTDEITFSEALDIQDLLIKEIEAAHKSGDQTRALILALGLAVTGAVLATRKNKNR